MRNKMILQFQAISENESFARGVISCFALKLNPSLEELSDVKTAVSEAVTNCIVHAYPNNKGIITLESEIENNVIHINIFDNGVGIKDVSKALEPFYTTKPDEERSGIGFIIMKSFMDSIKVVSKLGEGTKVYMTKKIKADVWFCMISQEQLLEHIRKAKKGNEQSKEIIFKSNFPLIKSIIRRFKNKGVEYDDLYQIACIGVLKAVNNFDENFGVKFSTYTVPMIVGEIKRFMRDNGAIKVSRNLKILANKISKFIDDFSLKNCRQPSIEIIAKEFEITTEEVVLAIDSVKMPLSIYDKFEDDEDGQELIDKIATVDIENDNVDRIHLSVILEQLPERERKIIFLRFFRDNTQSEVAKIFGVSQVQISRIENKILKKIRLKY